MKYLSSIKNPELKRLRVLYKKSRERKKQLLFVIEGLRELKKAIAGEYTICSLFIEEKYELEFKNIAQTLFESDQYLVSNTVFEQISFRSGSEKIIAIAKSKEHHLDSFNLKKNALILVIESPEKPGNIGALFRTAAAAKFDGVIVANPITDFYNPNSIRSSLGCLFLLPTAIASSDEVIEYLKEKEVFIATASLDLDAVNYKQFDYKTPCAIIMGNESNGLNVSWLKASNRHLIIPMSKDVDSLNLAVSAGILMYEAKSKNDLEKQKNL